MKSICHDAIAYLKLAGETGIDTSDHLQEDQQACIDDLGNGLAVVYMLDTDHKLVYVQNRDLQQAGYTMADLRKTGLQNLRQRTVENCKMQERGPIHVITCDGNFEASIILINELWDTQFATLFKNGIIAAIPSRDVLAFCDSRSEEGIEALKEMIRRVHNDGDHLLSRSLYRRQRGKWVEIKTGIEAAKPESMEEAHARLHAGMQANAEVLRKIAKEHFKVEIAYDIEGVSWVNQFLSDAHTSGSSDDHKNIVIFAGAFVGQCIVRNIGGKWDWHGDDYVIRTKDGKLFSPCSKVAKQLACGPTGDDSVLGLYKVIKDMYPAALSKAQRLLQVLYKRHGDYQFYIAAVLDQQLQWLNVCGMEDNWVKVERKPGNGESAALTVVCYLHQIHSYYVRSPGGVLMHAEGISESLAALLPDEVRKLIAPAKIIKTTFNEAELQQAQSIVDIQFVKYEGEDNDSDVYTIKLKNIATQKIKINKFAHFFQQDGLWQIGTALQTYYPASDFMDWFQLMSEWIEPGQEITATGRLGEPPVLWAFMGETEDAAPFTASLILREVPASEKKQKADAKRKASPYYSASQSASPEMESALKELRLNLDRNRAAMDAEILQRISAAKPDWMDYAEPLLEIILQQKRLISEGRVVWAALVQANSLLFEAGEHDHPAMLVYSEDPYFEARPHELRAIADKIYQLKSTKPDDPEEQLVAAHVSNEMDRNMGWQLPGLLTDKNVRAASFMIFRKHIPNGMLEATTFPLLIHPATAAVLIVPVAFWPVSMTALWRQGRLFF